MRSTLIIAIVLCCLLLCACQTPEPPAEESVMVDAMDQDGAETEAGKEPQIEAVEETHTIHHEKDNTTYSVTAMHDPNYFYTIQLFDAESHELQSVSLGWCPLGIDFLDVNLDGYMDIVTNTGGTLNETHELYIWDAPSQNFKRVLFNGFNTLTYFEVYDGYLMTWAKDTADAGVMQKLVWQGNVLDMKSEEQYRVESDLTALQNEVEKPQSLKTPPPEIPEVVSYNPNHAEMVDDYRVNYVYLTDGTQSTPVTLVQEGDTFLGWYVESVDAVFKLYDDGSIDYWHIYVDFKGELEIKVQLKYWQNDVFLGDDVVFAFVNEESYSLLPVEIDRDRDIGFQLYGSEALERLIAEEFSGEEGVLEDCTIVIQNFGLVFAYTEVTDYAKFVRLVRD